jgi:hypothetical protein
MRFVAAVATINTPAKNKMPDKRVQTMAVYIRGMLFFLMPASRQTTNINADAMAEIKSVATLIARVMYVLML